MMIEARTIWFLRLGQLVAALVMAFIVLGLSGNILNKSDGFSPDYAGLSLATAVLTLVAVAPIMIIDFFRANAISSFVVVEISWASVLTVLWLASAADTTAALGGSSCPSSITFNTGFGIVSQSLDTSFCHEQQALAAFGWLSFFNLLAWLVFLIVAASIAHTRGNSRVWFGPVTGTEFFAPAGRTEQSENAVEYAPPQQQGYVAQQGYPSPGAPQMQQQFTGGTMMDPPQQDPMAYPPNNGYNAGAPNQA